MPPGVATLGRGLWGEGREGEGVGELWKCKGDWVNGTLPERMVGCSFAGAGKRELKEGDGDGAGEGESVFFGMTPYTALGSRRAELSFVLEIVRVRVENSTV